MIKSIIFLFLSYSLFASFPDNITYKKNEMKLIGKTLLEYSIFKIDVYEIAYYKNKDESSSLIHLIYKRDIEKKISEQGWEKGLETKEDKNKKQIKWLSDNSTDMKEGEHLKIFRIAPNNVIIEKSGKVIAKSNDPEIFRVVFYPWIGKSPVDNSLKKKLLGD